MEIIKPKENELYNDYISRILSERNNTKDTENYQECHHIIPKSLGGSNEKNNLICYDILCIKFRRLRNEKGK